MKCPSIRRDPDDQKKEIAEPFAAEAKFFVESRLLQRDVKVILEGVSNQNILLATVLHPVSADVFACDKIFLKLSSATIGTKILLQWSLFAHIQVSLVCF